MSKSKRYNPNKILEGASIFAFSGKSGTGKSYHATNLCEKYGIKAIIDDGLFIYMGQVIAGKSAKRCNSKAEAMRTALFDDDAHRFLVIAALEEKKPERILVLGTSDNMVDWITDTLGLPRACKRIYINDITTEEEREIASFHRHKQGEHVIPVPMGELRRDFAGYILNPIKQIRDKALGTDISRENSDVDSLEQTVVRPKFSYCGNFSIGEQVLRDIVDITGQSFNPRVRIVDKMSNVKPENLIVTLDVAAEAGPDMVDNCIRLQHETLKMLHYMTAFTVESVNIRIKEINGYTGA